MTTPIPGAAIQAAREAADAIGLRRLDGALVYFANADEIRKLLAAALPLLGETEYAVYCPRYDRYIPAPSESAAIDMTGWHGCQGEHKIVTRIAGEWTEAPSE